MKCAICGVDNKDNAQFCSGCGSKFKQEGAIRPGIVGGGRKTQQETPEDIARAQAAAGVAAPAAGGRKTALESPEAIIQAQKAAGGAGGGAGRRTALEDAEPISSAAQKAGAPVAGTRPKVRGFLVSYSFDPSGEFFPLREGRNIVGSGTEADVVIARDAAMSRSHFEVMIRNQTILIADNGSMNMTKVDGQEIWRNSVNAQHGSLVQAGKSTFIFVLVPPLGE